MSSETSDQILNDIIAKYDGPALIERLQLLATRGGKIGSRASFLALQHLDKANQYSPHIEPFLLEIKNYIPNDSEVADIEKFTHQQWLISLQNNKVRKLRDLDVDGLYHETDVSKNIEISQIHLYGLQYGDAQTVLSTSGSLTCQLAEQSAQIGILQDHLQLTLNQDKRVEAFLSTSLSNELYLKRLTEKEITSYWRVKFYILYAEFLKSNYSEVSNQIYQLLRAVPIQTSSGKEISAFDVLNNSDFNKFIHKDEIVLISVLSILLSRPAHELLDVLSEDEFILLVGTKLSTFRPFFIAFNNAKFKDLYLLLDSLNSIVNNNFLFTRVWNSLKLTFRQAGYALYFSSVKRVSGKHLSHKLSIPISQLIREANNYIDEKKLEFKYDESTDIFEPAIINKREEFINLLQKATEDADVVESIIGERIEAMAVKFGTDLKLVK